MAKSETSSSMGVGKEYSDAKWYYMFLHNTYLKQYVECFTGKRAVRIRHKDDSETQEYYNFKVFSYTSADHKRRFERCTHTKEEYQERVKSSQAVKEAFMEDSAEKLNSLTDVKSISGDGYLFVCAPLDELRTILANMRPIQYLVTSYKTREPAEIPSQQMEEFIYLYESMPYNIELMEHPLEDYCLKRQRIRITGGIFAGKEGVIMRLHRNKKLVFAFGNMTVAINYIHAFQYEVLD